MLVYLLFLFFSARAFERGTPRRPKLLGLKRGLPKTRFVTKICSFLGGIYERTKLYRKMLTWLAKERRENHAKLPKVTFLVVAPN